jgi:hypothetical protein
MENNKFIVSHGGERSERENERMNKCIVREKGKKCISKGSDEALADISLHSIITVLSESAEKQCMNGTHIPYIYNKIEVKE